LNNAPQDNQALLALVGQCDTRLWRLSADDRIRRLFARAGVGRVAKAGEDLPDSGTVILVRSDMVLDAPIIAALTKTVGLLLLGPGPDGTRPVAAHVRAGDAAQVRTMLEQGTTGSVLDGIDIRTVNTLGANYWHALRKRETPYLLELNPENRRDVEWRSYMGTYKGVTDIVTKYVWPWPAFWATKLCVALRLTPNMVTFVGLLLTISVCFLFADGHWTVGLIAAWLMCFLDTVDGKLARVTLTSSRFGNVFDHGIDLIHPPFWYAAWAYGLPDVGLPLSESAFVWVLSIIIGGYVAQRIVEGLFIHFFKMEQHVWRRTDSLFRLITARRNPNLILLTVFVALGRPDWGLIAVAWWTALSLLFHLVRLAQAAQAKRRDGRLLSWLSEPTAS